MRYRWAILSARPLKLRAMTGFGRAAAVPTAQVARTAVTARLERGRKQRRGRRGARQQRRAPAAACAYTRLCGAARSSRRCSLCPPLLGSTALSSGSPLRPLGLAALRPSCCWRASWPSGLAGIIGIGDIIPKGAALLRYVARCRPMRRDRRQPCALKVEPSTLNHHWRQRLTKRISQNCYLWASPGRRCAHSGAGHAVGGEFRGTGASLLSTRSLIAPAVDLA